MCNTHVKKTGQKKALTKSNTNTQKKELQVQKGKHFFFGIA